MGRLGQSIRDLAGAVSGRHSTQQDGPLEPVGTPWRIQEAHGAFALSDDGATIGHARKGHDLAIVDKVLRSGVTKLSFKIIVSHNNKGHNMFIGVMDGDAQRAAPMPQLGLKSARELPPGKAGEAWAYHPYDGMIYHCPDAYQRGSKGQLLPGADGGEGDSLAELAHMRGEAQGQVLHMEIDMDRKRMRMAVGDDTAFVDTGVTLPAAVVPYVYLDWRDDAVELLGNAVELQERRPSRRLEIVDTSKNKQKGGGLTARAQALKGSNKKGGITTARSRSDDGDGPVGQAAKASTNAAPAEPAAPPPSGGFTDSMRLQLAVHALLAVHKRDPYALGSALPGFSLADETTSAFITKELERLHDKICPLEA